MVKHKRWRCSVDYVSLSSIFGGSNGLNYLQRHVSLLGHIILIPSEPVFALSSRCCVLSGEASTINFILFGFIRQQLEPTIYSIRRRLIPFRCYVHIIRRSQQVYLGYVNNVYNILYLNCNISSIFRVKFKRGYRFVVAVR
jgi:hypothetical protein